MIYRFLGALAMVALLAPSSLEAQGKIRVAIGDFENNAERSWWFYNDLGPAARNNIDTAFSESDILSSRFSVIEREKLDLVLQEQGLSTSGALDQQTAAKVGRILGIKYIITGGIDKFAINTTKGGFSGIGGSYTKAEAKINLRLIDTTTAERVIAVSGEGNVKKGGGFAKGGSLSRENEWGYRQRSHREGIRGSRRQVRKTQRSEHARRGRRHGRGRRQDHQSRGQPRLDQHGIGVRYASR